jgi:hypothetical protein
MIKMIKQASRMLGAAAFFIVFFASVNPEDPWNGELLAVALLKAVLAGALLWIAGFLIADIVFKGVLETVATTEEDIIEGGLLQRVSEERDRLNPDKQALHKAPDPGESKPGPA